MVTIMLRFRVGDYGRWREIFASRDALRRKAGCLGRRVFRHSARPDEVVVLLDWDDPARYAEFAATGIAQTAAGRDRAGIQGAPEELLLSEAEDIPPWQP